MAAVGDVRDILELESNSQEFITKDAIFNDLKKKSKPKKTDVNFKKPEGMHRELWGLLWTDNKDAPPIIPTDTNQGYKQMKAKIGQSRVRPWKWMPFTNPARKDGAIFYHWRRAADEDKDYPFARFNKTVDVPVYSDLEYQQHLHDESWTRQETDHLFDLCKRFGLRFVIIQDRYDKTNFPNRSIEDLKERYYNICNILVKVRAPLGTDPKIRVFDADHERRRKEQLNKLFNRTAEQVEEEEYLISELKKIELRKKEREKKTQDLQKLITAADSNMEARRSERKATKKKLLIPHKISEKNITPESTSIKFPDIRQSGVSLRSQRMKLPASVGQKKTKAIEQVLEELGLELNPIPTDDIVSMFNELRQDVVLLYELKLALANCEYELQTLRHRFETLAPGRMPELGISGSILDGSGSSRTNTESPTTKLSEAIDVVSAPSTPTNTGIIGIQKKRKAAIEQTNLLKKLKQKT
ncbi:hypothetical protein LSH36_25g09076 [Paralvinella palmiformis]|uniref:DNA methyltransferase 1-associated protein 1 n=1 Tax=Paralvinella palmiformis TaxID=53620 RepID=A0AAD9KAG1_9ANNE|nr:hypothetical protein LSH36_25g09076 [Paralvinella palmiformis]